MRFSCPIRFGIPFTGSGSFLVGLLQTVWAVLPMLDELGSVARSPFAHAINIVEGQDWLVVMVLTGLLLMVSSFTLYRKMRHIALVCSASVLLSTFAMLMAERAITSLTLSIPFVGVYCMVLLIADVKEKQARRSDGKT